MRILYVDAAGQLQILTEMPPGWDKANLKSAELLWIDLNHVESKEITEQFLTQQFGFHPLAIDDALNETHLPKVDDWETYLYIALQDIAAEANLHTITLPELDLFLGKQYLVTYHMDEVTAVDRVWQLCQRHQRWLQHGADHLVYRIIDEIVNNYTAVTEQLEAQIVQLEGQIFTHPSADLLERLAHYKRLVLHIRRTLVPQREVVNKLARDTFLVIGEKDQVYFRDVYDHMVRLYNQSDSVRDLLTGTMELNLSVMNNRMNDVMKTLTIITTLFMPLTFITGFFGMNFFQATLPLRAWTGTGMLAFTLAGMILLPLSMFYWMRRRAWM
ncbi:MAG: magnesium/cobalt transporter CorA [Anaerolineaceae bacterium]|nr:magnesium/cobalt transporter CorA [Anaerolineaceae bacterium]